MKKMHTEEFWKFSLQEPLDPFSRLLEPMDLKNMSRMKKNTQKESFASIETMMPIAARFKIGGRCSISSDLTHTRACSIDLGGVARSPPTSPDAMRDSRDVLAHLQLHDMQERECGRPPLGSREWGEHRSAATGSGCRSPSARAAKQWNQNSASLSLKKNRKKERK
jgi:hypothetical protein